MATICDNVPLRVLFRFEIISLRKSELVVILLVYASCTPTPTLIIK